MLIKRKNKYIHPIMNDPQFWALMWGVKSSETDFDNNDILLSKSLTVLTKWENINPF